jgi:hypothetical protein
MASISILSFALFLFSITTVESQAPANDECTGATLISSALPSVTTTTNFLKSTANANDPKPACFFDSNSLFPDYSIWYSWTPSITANYSITTAGSVRDPALPADYGNFLFEQFAIYKGSECTSLELIACAPNKYLTNVVLQANQTYTIFVRESDYSTYYPTNLGKQVISIAQTPPPPPNDECSTAVVIMPGIVLPYTAFEVDIDQATQNDVADKTCQLNKGDTVWARWTPASSGNYDFCSCDSRTLNNSTFSEFIRIVIYEGDSCAAATEVACDVGSINAISLEAGKTYFIKVQAQDTDNTLGGKVTLLIKEARRVGFFRRLIRWILSLLFGN